MNKAELIKEVSRQTNISQKQCMCFVSTLLDVIEQTLQKGEIITLAGFGKFYTFVTAPKNVFCPQTGVRLKLEPQILPKFKPSSRLKGQFLA